MEFHLEPIESQEIKVKILLSGGQEYTLWLNSHAPLLHHLLAAVMGNSPPSINHNQKWFNIPLEDGRAALSFPETSLVGVVTEPPLLLQSISSNWQTTNILVSPYLQIDNFLQGEEKEKLITYSLAKQSNFVATGPLTNTSYHPDHRQSWVLHHFPEFSEFFLHRLRKAIPYVLSKLGMQLFPIAGIEVQLTAHNDNNYFRLHNDNGTPETATRELTYSYYFYRDPKPFSGGDLLIYDTKIENSTYYKGDPYKIIEPRNNSIVFFPSHCYHEVMPVTCASKAFSDSRFTINGWIRRQ